MPVLCLDPGVLATRLTLQAPTDTPDGAGGAERNWTAVASLWARLEPVSAVGRELAGQAGQVITHRVTVRHRSDVALGQRFMRLERVFAIKAIHDPDESRRYLVCLCEEATP